jgi:hypothetical protein
VAVILRPSPCRLVASGYAKKYRRARIRVDLVMPSAEGSHWTSILFQVHSANSQRPRQQKPKEVWRGPGCISDESQAARGLCIRSPLFTLHFTDHDGRPPTPSPKTDQETQPQRRDHRLSNNVVVVASTPSHPIPSHPSPYLPCIDNNDLRYFASINTSF